jgi:type I restriction enzyme S subunit
VPVLAGRIRAAVLAEAFSGKLAGEDDVVYLPCEQWIASTFYGPRFSKDDYVSEGIPTARTTDFNDDGSMSLATAPRVACSPPDFAKWGLAEGDLLVTRTGSIGKCAVYDPSDGPMLPSAYLIRVRFTPAIITRFAWMMFASPQGQAHLGVNSRAVTQPNINASAIRSLPFPALTLNQQNATISAVDAAFARADRLEAEAARARQLLDRLEAAILARAFRGELVPQDPADEPASVLLDRIRAAAPKAKRGRKAKEEA